MSDFQTYQLSMGPDMQSLIQLMIDKVDDANRSLVVVRTSVPENSTTRVYAAYDCSFVFFFDRRKSTAHLVDLAQFLCAEVHDPSRQRDSYRELESTDPGVAALRRCCRIASPARTWLFYDRTLATPLVPCCSESDIKKHTSPFFTCVTAHESLRVASDETAYKNVIAGLPAWERLSHRAPLCRTEVRRVIGTLTDTLRDVVGTTLCQSCAAEQVNKSSSGGKTPLLPTPPTLLVETKMCMVCLTRACHWLAELRKWSKLRGVQCSGKRECLCIYDYLLKTSASVIELDAVVQPCDPTYESMADSIYDRRSPIIAEMLADKDESNERMQRVVNCARLRRSSHNIPKPLQGYTFANTFTYAEMLEQARRLYAQTDTPSLCQIAVRNASTEFIDNELFSSLNDWMPPAAIRLLADLTPTQLHQRVVEFFGLDKGVFSQHLEKTIYEEIGCSSNRRMSLARIFSLVVPMPNTMDRYRAGVVYLAAVLGLLQLCEHVATKIGEERALRVLAALEAEKIAREQRAEEARQRERERKLKQRKAQRTKRAASASADQRREKSMQTKRANLDALAAKQRAIPKGRKRKEDQEDEKFTDSNSSGSGNEQSEVVVSDSTDSIRSEEEQQQRPTTPETIPIINETITPTVVNGGGGTSTLPEISVEFPVEECVFLPPPTLRATAKEFVPEKLLRSTQQMRDCATLLGSSLSVEIFHVK